MALTIGLLSFYAADQLLGGKASRLGNHPPEGGDHLRPLLQQFTGGLKWRAHVPVLERFERHLQDFGKFGQEFGGGVAIAALDVAEVGDTFEPHVHSHLPLREPKLFAALPDKFA